MPTDPDPGFTGQTPDPSAGAVLPDPIGKDPNVGKPPVDPCYGAMLGAGQVEADLQAVPKAAVAFDTTAAGAAAVASPVLVLSMAIGLVVLVLGGAAAGRRRRLGQ